MRPDPRTEAEVTEVLARIVDAAGRRDTQAALGFFADDPDTFLYGTGADEARKGPAEIREQIERDLSQSEAWSWTLGQQSISSAGAVAWTAGDVVIRVVMGDRTLDVPHRLTLVLERRDGKWLILQMHLSVANGSQAIGQSFPTNLEAVTEAVGRERVDLQGRVAPDGTVTLMFTDIEDSTPLAERLGDLRWFALLREHNAIVREQIARFGGFEVKTIGDAFMVAFGSARRGVLCALGIQEGISRYGVEHPDQAVRVRIGLHAGEPIREGNDFHGKSVVLASRVAGTASGGQILVSALMRELTESAGDIRFEAAREVVLKGLAGTHRVYPVCGER
jgi:class 3 adenylate cyclase/ketosteroid isomerase-like protein